MTDKIFYQQAVHEMDGGEIDEALLIKVEADNPEATKAVQRAIYIRARAQELARERVRGLPAEAMSSKILSGLAPQKPWHWLLYSITVFFIASIIAEIGGSTAGGTLFLLVLTAGAVAALLIRRYYPSVLPPIEWSAWSLWFLELALLTLLWVMLVEPVQQDVSVSFLLGDSLVPLCLLSIPGSIIAFGTDFRRPLLAMGCTLVWGVIALLIGWMGFLHLANV